MKSIPLETLVFRYFAGTKDLQVIPDNDREGHVIIDGVRHWYRSENYNLHVGTYDEDEDEDD